MLKNSYDRSMELVNQFIIEEHDELMNIINRCEKLDIKGPTYYEYCDNLQEQLKNSMKNYDKKWKKRNRLLYCFR